MTAAGAVVSIGIAPEQDDLFDAGEPVDDLPQRGAPVMLLTGVTVVLDGDEQFRLDLAEAVDGSGRTELRAATGPDGADRSHGEQGDRRLAGIGQIAGHPI